MPNIPMTEVESDNIFAIGYDAEIKTMYVRFKSWPKKDAAGVQQPGVPTSLYSYEHVDAATYRRVTTRFIEDSVTKSFNGLVKAHPTKFPYTKLESAPGVPATVAA